MKKDVLNDYNVTCPFCGAKMDFVHSSTTSMEVEETNQTFDDFYKQAFYKCKCGAGVSLNTNDWKQTIDYLFIPPIQDDLHVTKSKLEKNVSVVLKNE